MQHQARPEMGCFAVTVALNGFQQFRSAPVPTRCLRRCIMAFQTLINHYCLSICLKSGAAKIPAEAYRPCICASRRVDARRRSRSTVRHSLDRSSEIRIAQFDITVLVVSKIDRTIRRGTFHMANTAVIIGTAGLPVRERICRDVKEKSPTIATRWVTVPADRDEAIGELIGLVWQSTQVRLPPQVAPP